MLVRACVCNSERLSMSFFCFNVQVSVVCARASELTNIDYLVIDNFRGIRINANKKTDTDNKEENNSKPSLLC